MTSLLLAALALAATPANTGSILAAADAFDRAQLAQDQAAMEWMVLDDLVFVDGSGKRLGKKELIAGWMEPGDRFDRPPPLIARSPRSAGTRRWSGRR